MKIYNLQSDIFVEEYDLTTHLIKEYDDYYHTHTYFELFYMIDGEIRHSLNGSITTLHTGDLYLLCPGDIHCFLREKANPSVHRDIMITEKQWKRACDYIGPDTLYKFLNSGSSHTVISSERIIHFERMLTKISANATNTKTHNAYINALCAELIEVFLDSEPNEERKEYPAWLRQLLDKFNMADNFMQGIDQVLSFVNYDHSYVCRTFKKYVGMTMTDYLNLLRLNYAAMLLQTKNDSITHIAIESGFANVPYFNRCFKRRYGITPSEFQKNPSSLERFRSTR